jgi:hypothetical protein
MEDMKMVYIKFISLVIAIWFTVVNLGLIKHKQDVSALNILIQAISIAVFVFIQFKLF